MRLLAAVIFSAVVAAACAAPVPTPSMTGLPATALAPTPDTEPASSFPSPVATPIQTPLPTPGYSPPPVATSLAVDGLARVVVGRLRQVVDSENPSANPRDRRAPEALVEGEVVLLTARPRSVDGRDFWQVFDDSPPLPFLNPVDALGWVPAQRDGIATLTPFMPECPPTVPTTAADLQHLRESNRFVGFACFGSRDIVLSGHVHCHEGHGDGVLGAPFFDGRRTCTLDGSYLSGEPIFDLLPETGGGRAEIEGTYEVRGRFDHPDSDRCTWIPFGTSGPSGPPDPGAVASCRLLFVVTGVTGL